MPSSLGFLRSRLFFVWLAIVIICLAITLFIRLGVAEKVRSYFQDGEVQFSSTPAGAQVFVNGENLGPTPLHKKLLAGKYQVVFERGTWQLPQEFTVKVRETSQVSAKFNYATLNFTSQPDGVQIILDGISIGVTPVNASEVTPGNHTLLYRQGAHAMSESVSLKEGDAVTRNISFGLEQSTIEDGTSIILTVPEPAAWIGVWKGVIKDNFLYEKNLNATSTETLKVNPDLHTGMFLDQHGPANTYVPVVIFATGTSLNAKGSTPLGNYGFSVNLTLTHFPDHTKAMADIFRHYFYFNTERESSKSSGTLEKTLQ